MRATKQRVTRLELATSSLARRCSTTELHPRRKAGCNNVQRPLWRKTNLRRLRPKLLESKPPRPCISLHTTNDENTSSQPPLLQRRGSQRARTGSECQHQPSSRSFSRARSGTVRSSCSHEHSRREAFSRSGRRFARVAHRAESAGSGQHANRPPCSHRPR